MDESQRDIYNRFGDNNLEFDPRKDEMKLLADIASNYLFWIFIGYLTTLPSGARASRIWITIIGIALLAVEIALSLTQTNIPTFFPEKLTEYELILLLHLIFPCIIVLLRCLSEYLYVDINKTSINVLTNVTETEKYVKELLDELLNDLTDNKTTSNKNDLKEKIMILKNAIESKNDENIKQILLLKDSSSNPGSKYYWIIFVLIYGGIYLIQQ